MAIGVGTSGNLEDDGGYSKWEARFDKAATPQPKIDDVIRPLLLELGVGMGAQASQSPYSYDNQIINAARTEVARLKLLSEAELQTPGSLVSLSDINNSELYKIVVEALEGVKGRVQTDGHQDDNGDETPESKAKKFMAEFKAAVNKAYHLGLSIE